MLLSNSDSKFYSVVDSFQDFTACKILFLGGKIEKFKFLRGDITYSLSQNGKKINFCS